MSLTIFATMKNSLQKNKVLKFDNLGVNYPS